MHGEILDLDCTCETVLCCVQLRSSNTVLTCTHTVLIRACTAGWILLIPSASHNGVLYVVQQHETWPFPNSDTSSRTTIGECSSKIHRATRTRYLLGHGHLESRGSRCREDRSSFKLTRLSPVWRPTDKRDEKNMEPSPPRQGLDSTAPSSRNAPLFQDDAHGERATIASHVSTRSSILPRRTVKPLPSSLPPRATIHDTEHAAAIITRLPVMTMNHSTHSYTTMP